VVLAARRRQLLDELIAASERPERGLALSLDTADPTAPGPVVDDAAAYLEPHGGLDTVIYAAGTAPLGAIATTTAAEWHEVLSTNLVGAAMVVAASLTHLTRPAGVAAPTIVLLSSHSVGDPWPGLVPYGASKAGLDQLALGLRAEVPAVRTICVAVGPTATSFADGWDQGRAGPYFNDWAERGYLRHEVLEPDQTAAAILAALDDPDAPDDLKVIGEG